MTERLREIEQRCEKADEVVGGSSAGWAAYLQDIPDLIAEIKRLREIVDNFPATWTVPSGMIPVATREAHAREDIPYLLGVIKEQAERIQELTGMLEDEGVL